MLHNRVYLVFLAVLLLVPCWNASAQLNTNSPYSRFGLGELNPQSFAHHNSMAGLSIGTASVYSLNIVNPASLATFVPKSIFEGGTISRLSSYQTSLSESKARSTYLSNVAIGMNASKRWGLAFGLMPYSSVGYTMTETENISGVGDVQYLFEGTGGINRVFFANGVELFNKNDSAILSLGVNASYFFGHVKHSRKGLFPVGFFDAKVQSNLSVSDVALDLGLQHKVWLNKNVQMIMGLTFAPTSQLKAKEDFLAATFITDNAIDIPVDTISFTDGAEGLVTLPKRLGLGFSMNFKNKWLLGADYTTQGWSNYSTSFDSLRNESLTNSARLALGIQFTPASRLLTNAKIMRMARYRVGFQYNKAQFEVNSMTMKDYGISFGVGLPLVKSLSLSSLNIGMEMGKRGTTENNLVQENYTRIFVGLSLSPNKRDRWFVKRKID